MATPDRDTIYTNDGTNRTVYTRENNSTAWFIGIVVALALLAIAYLVFSANSQPSTTTINNTPAVTAPADTNALPNSDVAPMTPAASAPAETAPATPAPATAPSAATSTAPAPVTDASAAQ